MASAQIAGLWRLYRQLPNGDKRFITQLRVEQSAPAGGASEGAGSAVSTPEKLLTIASSEIFAINDVLMVSFTTDVAATIGTVTKSIWSIPLLTSQGTKTLGRAQFTTPTLAAQALVAAIETFVAGYTVTETGARLNGKIYMDLQNNA